MSDTEFRFVMDAPEFRSKGRELRAAGYGAVFNKASVNLGGFIEQVAPGAFKRTIKNDDVLALFNHNRDQFLGRSKAGTLRLSEDKHGLIYEIDLPDTTVGRDLAHLLERGDVRGSSFGFRTIKDSWGETESGYPLRSLEEVLLHDVGPVVNPAYPDTSAAMRSLAHATGHEVSEVKEAAARDELRSFIRIGEPATEPDTEVTPTVRHRRLSMFA